MARQQVLFWLDTEKPGEAWLLEQIESLKAQRLFSPFIRDGLALAVHLGEWGIPAKSVHDLLADLQAGNTDQLLAVFPALRETLSGRSRGSLPALPAPEVKVVPTADPDAIFDDFMAFIQ